MELEGSFYHVHKSPQPAPCQMNPVHTLPPDFIKIHFNIVLPPIYAQIFWVVTKMLFALLIFLPCMLHTSISSSLIWSS
jgi:hypothetical protein